MRTWMRPALFTFALLAGLVVAVGEARSADDNRRPSDKERGAELYQRHCVQCHGARVDGKGPATAALVHPVPDLRGKVSVDKEAEHIVLRGRQAMPGFLRSFGVSDARSVLRQMKRLSERPADAAEKTEEVPAHARPARQTPTEAARPLPQAPRKESRPPVPVEGKPNPERGEKEAPADDGRSAQPDR